MVNGSEAVLELNRGENRQLLLPSTAGPSLFLALAGLWSWAPAPLDDTVARSSATGSLDDQARPSPDDGWTWTTGVGAEVRDSVDLIPTPAGMLERRIQDSATQSVTVAPLSVKALVYSLSYLLAEHRILTGKHAS
jgi:hypothetical protein